MNIRPNFGRNVENFGHPLSHYKIFVQILFVIWSKSKKFWQKEDIPLWNWGGGCYAITPPPGFSMEYLIFVKISKILLKIKTSLERIYYYNRDFDPNLGRPYNLRDFVEILSLYWSKFWPKFSIFRPNFYILNKMFKILTKNFESLTFDILIKMFKISIKMMEIYYKVSSAAAFR